MFIHSSKPTEYVRLCARADLPDYNECRELEFNGRMLCVANVKGRFVAMDNVCPHQGGPLGQGTVERGYIVCPWHGWQINPHSGVPQENRKCKVAVYALCINGDDVLISTEPVR